MTVATPFLSRFSGSSLTARALRSSLLTAGGFGGSQLIRLLSNLALTRLLFPEAFGLMALVTVFLIGLGQFSDVGVTPAILQNKRGDDPKFLNTAWTIQVIRGVCLFVVACLIAWPVSVFYDQPQLLELLPVAALSLLIAGFNPTRLDTANRHLLLGRVTAIEFTTQLIGVIGAIILAWITGSVWSLVASGLISAAVQLYLLDRFLPGQRNRFHWDAAAAQDLISFGKWIFLSTVCGFFFTQGDKLLMGEYLPIDIFGVYNIGFFLASFPMLLGGMVTRKILIPIYRETPPGVSRENFRKMRKMRMLVTAFLLALVALLALIGVWLIGLLYDPRYQMAGAVVVMIAVTQIPQIIVLTYDQAALAAGDSRRFFLLALARAVLMVVCVILGLEMAGLVGGILGQGAAMLLAYPVVVWLSLRSAAWDPLHDALFAGLGAGLAVFSVWFNWPAVSAMIHMSGATG